MPTHWAERLLSWWKAGGRVAVPAPPRLHRPAPALEFPLSSRIAEHLVGANGAVQSGAGGLTGTRQEAESAGRGTVVTSCPQVFPSQNGGQPGRALAAVMAAWGRHLTSLSEALQLNWLRKWLMCIMELRVAGRKGVSGATK